MILQQIYSGNYWQIHQNRMSFMKNITKTFCFFPPDTVYMVRPQLLDDCSDNGEEISEADVNVVSQK